MPDNHKNFAFSNVATGPSPATSGTSLVVTAGHGTRFPSVPFNAVIWPHHAQPLSSNAEIVRVTAISTDTFTIVRTQESTSARAVAVGDQIAAAVTNKTITDAEQHAWLPFGYPKTFPNSSVDHHFNGTLGPWTAVDGTSGTCALLETSTSVQKYDLGSWPGYLLLQTGHAVTTSVRADYALADGEGVTAPINLGGILTASGDNYRLGISVNDNDTGPTAGNYTSIAIEQDTTTVQYQLFGSVGGGDTFTSAVSPLGGAMVLFRLIRSGSAYLGWISSHGGSWQSLGSNTPAATATNVWIYQTGASAGQTYMPIGAVPFIRVGGNGFLPW